MTRSTRVRRDAVIIKDPWQQLRKHTNARIALGRAGVSSTTSTHLAFQLDHAAARDAVHVPLDIDLLAEDLEALGLRTRSVRSQAANRATYLQRPDLGRRLCSGSLEEVEGEQPDIADSIDVALVMSDGLSSRAVQSHGPAMVSSVCTALSESSLRVSPVYMVRQGRVAIGDEIGAALKARSVVNFIGERPGLSSPDSLGIYYTYNPRVGLTDAFRNCLSNIRPEGMSVPDATQKLLWLIKESFRRGLSGVDLKDNSDELLLPRQTPAGNFLLD